MRLFGVRSAGPMMMRRAGRLIVRVGWGNIFRRVIANNRTDYRGGEEQRQDDDRHNAGPSSFVGGGRMGIAVRFASMANGGVLGIGSATVMFRGCKCAARQRKQRD